MKAYFDTPILVAGLVVNHPQHQIAHRVLREVQAQQVEGCISNHCLAEFYAVSTRLPITPRVTAAQAWELLKINVLPYVEIRTLSAEDYQDVIRKCASAGRPGGLIYDALHVKAAEKAGCDRIYTFNIRHFQQLAPDRAHIIQTP